MIPRVEMFLPFVSFMPFFSTWGEEVASLQYVVRSSIQPKFLIELFYFVH